MSLFTKTDIMVKIEIIKLVGKLIFIFGMLVFAWATAYLKGAFLGKVEPVSDAMITIGPYRFVRHPVYLGMIISTIGIVIMLRSLWGIIAVFLFFVPIVIYRAKLEEKAMARRFGKKYADYTKQTYCIFPPIY